MQGQETLLKLMFMKKKPQLYFIMYVLERKIIVFCNVILCHTILNAFI